MIFDRAINRMRNEITSADTQRDLTLTNPQAWRIPGLLDPTSTSAAMKVSAVSACVDIRSDSVGKLPFYVMNNRTKEHKDRHYLNYLLAIRPNPQMTPFTFKKLLETWRLMRGNAYVWIIRSSRSGIPIELIPLHPDCVEPLIGREDRRIYYYYSASGLKKPKIFLDEEIIHLKGFSDDGIKGTSVLERAAEVIGTAREQQKYEGNYYGNNSTPVGILSAEGVLTKEARAKVHSEWEEVYGRPDNRFKVAVLDSTMKYQSVALSQKDSQFVESKEIAVADIARFFLMPLYKIQAGKQSYSSNEQNAIDYVTTALHPTVTQYEEEFSYQLLFDSELREGLEVKINMNAELRGDITARGEWYKKMRDNGAYSVNDIRGYEDLPSIAGGDTRLAPLNSIPLEKAEEYFDYLMNNKKVANQGGDPQ